ncbi:MAG: flagellar hook-associated protein FlgK [Deltaproteobacteria bacterium]|nr:flagellar hook-associated protein FlgK [Deltaproteobacteria bacterium]
MSLFSLLNTAGQGLFAQRAASHTASNNLANVNTEGYARQRVDLGAATTTNIRGSLLGGGVEVLGVHGARDRFLEAQSHATFGQASRAESQATTLMRVTSFDLDSPTGINNAVANFYASMRDVSVNPSDPSARHGIIGASKQLAISFNQSVGEIERARVGVDEALLSDVQKANQLASTVADLNKVIARETASGRPPLDLIDQRVRISDELAALTGATPIRDDDGNINLFIGGEVALVHGDHAATMSTQINAANNGHRDVVVTSGAGARVVTGGRNLLGGSMGGQVDARDGALLDAVNELDTLAFELSETVNALHISGTGLDGNSGRALFTNGGAQAGAAANFAVEALVADNPNFFAASASGAPGDGDNVLAMLATESAALPSGEDPRSMAASILSAFGAETERAIATADQEMALKSHFENMRASFSGVSVDEEMIMMTQAQRAFDAMSKVVQTTDQMLQTLLELK